MAYGIKNKKVISYLHGPLSLSTELDLKSKSKHLKVLGYTHLLSQGIPCLLYSDNALIFPPSTSFPARMGEWGALDGMGGVEGEGGGLQEDGRVRVRGERVVGGRGREAHVVSVAGVADEGCDWDWCKVG